MEMDKESLETSTFIDIVQSKNTQIKGLQRMLEERETQIQKLVESNLEKDAQLESQKSKTISDQLEIKRLKLDVLVQKSMQELIDTLTIDKSKLIAEKTELKKQLEQKESLILENQKTYEEITTELEECSLKVTNLNSDLVKCQKVNESLTGLMGKNQHLESQLKFYKEKVEKVDKEMDGWKKESEGKLSSLQSLLRADNYITLGDEEDSVEMETSDTIVKVEVNLDDDDDRETSGSGSDSDSPY